MFEYSLYFRSFIPFHILISIYQKHFPIPYSWTPPQSNHNSPFNPEAKSLLFKIIFHNPNGMICFLYPFILYPQSKPIPILNMTKIHFPPSLKNSSLNQTNVSFDTMTIPILILSHIPYPIHYPISHIPYPYPVSNPHSLPFLCHPLQVSVFQTPNIRIPYPEPTLFEPWNPYLYPIPEYFPYHPYSINLISPSPHIPANLNPQPFALHSLSYPPPS